MLDASVLAAFRAGRRRGGVRTVGKECSKSLSGESAAVCRQSAHRTPLPSAMRNVAIRHYIARLLIGQMGHVTNCGSGEPLRQPEMTSSHMLLRSMQQVIVQGKNYKTAVSQQHGYIRLRCTTIVIQHNAFVNYKSHLATLPLPFHLLRPLRLGL